MRRLKSLGVVASAPNDCKIVEWAVQQQSDTVAFLLIVSSAYLQFVFLLYAGCKYSFDISF